MIKSVPLYEASVEFTDKMRKIYEREAKSRMRNIR